MDARRKSEIRQSGERSLAAEMREEMKRLQREQDARYGRRPTPPPTIGNAEGQQGRTLDDLLKEEP